MPEFNVYKLHFTSPLHIGDNRSDHGISLKKFSLTQYMLRLHPVWPN